MVTTRTAASRLAAATLATAVLAAGQLTAWSATARPDGDARRVATERLQAEAGDGLRLSRLGDGTVTFAGVPAGERIVNPAVTRSTRVRAAARAHLQRYGAAFGTTRAGHSFRVLGTARTASRQDTVRFQQRVSGVPVIGGQVVVALRDDRQLGSVLATLSATAPLPSATITSRRAARLARRAVAATVDVRRLPVRAEGRWVWDPRALGTDAPYAARGVWRFTVGDRVTVNREVLVDDRTGAVLLDADAHQEVLDRVVCDRGNIPGPQTTCTSGVRTEASGPHAVNDVNAAFDHAGSVSAFYFSVGGVDLTDLLGVTVAGDKKLAASVRYCDPEQSCPYANAFWNGTQMFYGNGYALADDVVGHEMTHGVIERNADLFYWGQSGAINESIADIMGEIVDHRNALDGGDLSWPLGEDLPGGAIRSLSNPPSGGQPDLMTSGLWDSDTFGYFDNGGVHTNSGVGNKAAYLISQGGTFNNQTITGIDGGDTALTRTAELYYDAILRLTSGSDYADLADVLEQTCQDFVSGGLNGFTQAHCTDIGKVITATQMRITPSQAPQPTDAAMSCPGGVVPRVLFDSEVGPPGAAFTAGSTWAREGSNATSGHESWFSDNPPSTVTSGLTASTPVSLPAGQLSYLWFEHWRLLHYSGSTYFDGGTVELDDAADAQGMLDTSGMIWVNGPSQTLQAPNAGRRAFAGDSFGWLASRTDLSAYAGRPVTPRFSMRTGPSGGYLGWWLDDVRVYTCDGVAATPGAPGGIPEAPPPPPPPASTAPSAPTSVKAVGGLGKAVVSWQAPATNPGSVTGYQVSIGDVTKTVTAAERTVTLSALQAGTNYTFRVIAIGSGNFLSPAATASVRGTVTKLKVAKAGVKTKLSGVLKAGSKGISGKVLKVYAQKGKKWIKVGKAKTGKGGKYVLKLKGTTKRKYRVKFLGSGDLMGSQSPKRRL